MGPDDEVADPGVVGKSHGEARQSSPGAFLAFEDHADGMRMGRALSQGLFYGQFELAGPVVVEQAQQLCGGAAELVSAFGEPLVQLLAAGSCLLQPVQA